MQNLEEIKEEWLISLSSFRTVDDMADWWLKKIQERELALWQDYDYLN